MHCCFAAAASLCCMHRMVSKACSMAPAPTNNPTSSGRRPAWSPLKPPLQAPRSPPSPFLTHTHLGLRAWDGE